MKTEHRTIFANTSDEFDRQLDTMTEQGFIILYQPQTLADPRPGGQERILFTATLQRIQGAQTHKAHAIEFAEWLGMRDTQEVTDQYKNWIDSRATCDKAFNDQNGETEYCNSCMKEVPKGHCSLEKRIWQRLRN